MSHNTFKAMTVAGILSLGAIPAYALSQDSTFDRGDVILGFQQLGGSKALEVNLGAAIGYRDATTTSLNFANIGSILVSTYGDNWFTDTSLFAGAMGLRDRTSSNDDPAVNGDFANTLYYTTQRTAAGIVGVASSAPANKTEAQADAASVSAFTLSTTYLNADSGDADGFELFSPQSSTAGTWEDFNPFSGSNPGTSFGQFANLQDKFGTGWDLDATYAGISNVAAVWDFYRLAGYEGGGSKASSYEGTLVLDRSGRLSFIAAVPEPTSFGLISLASALGLILRRRRRA